MKPAWFNLWYETAALSIILAETCWVGLLYLLLNAFPSGLSVLKTGSVLGSILYSAFLLARLLNYRQVQGAARFLLLAAFFVGWELISFKSLIYFSQPMGWSSLISRLTIAGGAETGFMGVSQEFILFPAVLLIGLRGMHLARLTLDTTNIARIFQTGIVLMLVYGLFASAYPHSMFPEWVVVLFLAAGLLSLSTARISSLNRAKIGRQIPWDRQRVLGVFGSVAGLVLLAFSAAGLVKSQPIYQAASYLYKAVGAILLLLISPLIFLWISLLNRLLASTESSLAATPTPTPTPTPAPLLTPVPGSTSSIAQNLPSAGLFIFIILAAVALLLVLVLVIRVSNSLLSRRKSSPENPVEELEAGSLLNNLRAGLQNLFGGNRLKSGGRILAAARIRRIYTQLMDLCEKMKNPRPASRTPREFLPVLESLFPGYSTELQIITDAYQRVRYGRYPETRQEVDVVEKAWQQIRRSKTQD